MAPYTLETSLAKLCERSSPSTLEFRALEAAKLVHRRHLKDHTDSIERVKTIETDLVVARAHVAELLESQQQANHALDQAHLSVS